MQKQHVKLGKQLSSRALPSRPHSESVRLRSLPSTPAISSQRPVSSLANFSGPGGHLGPLQEILTMENGASDTYDTPDGCVFSKTSTDKKSSDGDEPLEYATSSTMRHLVEEQKFRSLPRLPRTPSGDSDGIYSVASGDRSSGQSLASLYSQVGDQFSSSSHQLAVGSSDQDLYSVVDKSAKNTLKVPPGQSSQPQDIYSVVDKSSKNTADQPQDIYSVVDKSAKVKLPVDPSSGLASAHSVANRSARFRKGKSVDQLSTQATEELQGISHRPVVKKKPIRPLQQQQSLDPYSVVEKKNKPSIEERHEDVYSEIGNPTITAVTDAHNSLTRHQSAPLQEQLYSVVQRPPAVKERTKRPPPGDIYSVVNKSPPQVKPKPRQYNSEHATSDQLRPADMANGDIYSVVNKPPPVAKKPDRQKRILSDSSVTMATGTQDDAASRDDVSEDDPVIPERCYDDDELELDDEPPELPPRLYSLSDFDTEDELCFDDIMEDLIPDRTFENPLYQSIISCKPQGQGEEEPLYQTLASFRKEMEDNKPKTGTLKVSKYCRHIVYIICYFN